MIFCPQPAMERAMKIQEVILRAMAKKITWCQAAEIIGISDRQMRRWYQRYQEFGYDGLFDRRLGRPSPKRSAGRDSRTAAGTLPRPVFRSERATLLREAVREAQHPPELHLGQDGAARGRAREIAAPRANRARFPCIAWHRSKALGIAFSTSWRYQRRLQLPK